MRDLLLVLFLCVAVFYAFKRPYLGVAAWVWIALTAPAAWAFGFSQDFRLNLTIVLVTALAWLFVQKQKSFRIGGIGILVLLFCFWKHSISFCHEFPYWKFLGALLLADSAAYAVTTVTLWGNLFPIFLLDFVILSTHVVFIV